MINDKTKATLREMEEFKKQLIESIGEPLFQTTLTNAKNKIQLYIDALARLGNHYGPIEVGTILIDRLKFTPMNNQEKAMAVAFYVLAVAEMEGVSEADLN